MRADRLMNMLLLLQSRRRWTAAALAERLEVTTRTVHRDLASLEGSGVPLQTFRGAQGGIALMEGWKTELTGLTRQELQAIGTVGEVAGLDALRLSAPLRSGLLKVSAALPSFQRVALEHARQRLHLDPSSFFSTPERVPKLVTLRDAAWQDRRVRLRYRDFEGAESRREVDPYGLVMKGDRWYLVAGTAEGPRVFRGARISEARTLSTRFERPTAFDLPVFWRRWCARFAEARPSYQVELRCDEAGLEALSQIRPNRESALLSRSRRGSDGRRRVTLDFEREAIALSQLLPLGRAVEVIRPDGLRQRFIELAAQLAARYPPTPRRKGASRRGAPRSVR